MKDFFKSTRFKVLLLIFFLLLGFMTAAARYGILGELADQVVSTVTSPFRSLSTSISNKATELFERFGLSSAYYDENQRLVAENRELRKSQADYNELKAENEQLRALIGIKEQNPDQQYVLASVVGRDPLDQYYTLTLNKGTLDGVKVGDTVMTPDGLVGIITEASAINSKVKTILNPSLLVGAFSTGSRDQGVVSGDLTLALEGRIKMSHVLNEALLAPGDSVVTIGGEDSPYPPDIFIGTVLSVEKESTGTSKYAVIQPPMDISAVKDVVIITDFQGKTSSQLSAEGVSDLPTDGAAAEVTP